MPKNTDEERIFKKNGYKYGIENFHFKNGSKMTQTRFYDFDKGLTREQIKKKVQEISNGYKKRGQDLSIQVGLQYPEGWRSGYFTKTGETVYLYHHTDSNDFITQDPKTFDEFRIYTLNVPARKGGNNENNDCLYECLIKIIPIQLLPWKQPISLKTFLKLNRKDKIPIDCIPKIEKKLKKYAINVMGDHVYSSTMKSEHIINLTLITEHYEI